MYPYCRYLRTLDLRDLTFLLEDDKFRGKILKNFFAGDLARFNVMMDTRVSSRGPKRPRLNARAILLAVGGAITKQSPLLEVLTEPVMPGLEVFSSALLEWPAQLSKLQFLQLGDGKALADERIHDLLTDSCPLLNKLEIYKWLNYDKADQCLARFLRRMKPNTLTHFQNESDCGIGPETCQALAYHAGSLTNLHLAISDTGLPGLGFLQPCTLLESLTLTDLRPPHDLKNTQNDVFTDMVAWLQQCSSLVNIALTNFVSAPALLTPMLDKYPSQLDHLEVNASENSLYMVKDHQDFHHAIGRQEKLTSLMLMADADGTFGDDVQSFCDCLCRLRSLKRLNLTRIAEYFSDVHMNRLSESLLELEELFVDGYGITDSSLTKLSDLPYLKSLTFSGLSVFTMQGLLDFVNRLGQGNQGFTLSIEGALTEQAQDIVREAIAVKVNGRFEYQAHRDPDISEFEGSDSD